MAAARPFASALDLLSQPGSPSAQDFAREGCVILRNFAPPKQLAQLQQQTADLLDPLSAPVEFESEVHSPAAPSRGPGRPKVPRRLRYAFGRHPVFRQWAQDPSLLATLRRLAWPRAQEIWLTQNHHNCIMTKMPQYSSESGWHQDLRYWNFSQGDLVTAWLALTPEDQTRGALQLVPRSHTLKIPEQALDEHRFLRDDHPQGQELLQKARAVELAPGDLLLFHCRLLHAAGANQGDRPKLALVFSYRHEQDLPVAGTRSSRMPDLLVDRHSGPTKKD